MDENADKYLDILHKKKFRINQFVVTFVVFGVIFVFFKDAKSGIVSSIENGYQARSLKHTGNVTNSLYNESIGWGTMTVDIIFSIIALIGVLIAFVLAIFKSKYDHNQGKITYTEYLKEKKKMWREKEKEKRKRGMDKNKEDAFKTQLAEALKDDGFRKALALDVEVLINLMKDGYVTVTTDNRGDLGINPNL